VADLERNLANERTQLAWWRTGLASLAVALAVGRLLPTLVNTRHAWPFTAVGVGFGVYALLLVGYGTVRARAVTASIKHGGGTPSQEAVLVGLTAIGLALITATTVLILVA
jgi:putative membrane protein